MKTKTRQGPDFWHTHCQRWQESGITQVEYCQQNQISVKTFCRWRGQFKREATDTAVKRKKRSKPHFVPTG